MVAIFGLAACATALGLSVAAMVAFRGQWAPRIATAIFASLLVVDAALSSVVIIQEGFEGVLLTFGRAADTPLKPGLVFKLPWQEVEKIDMMDERFDLELECSSKDLQSVQYGISVTWRKKPGRSPEIYREFAHDVRKLVVEPQVPEAVKATTAKYDATSCVTKRPELHSLTVTSLREELEPLGIEIVEMSFAKIVFTPEFQAAIDKKQAAFEKANKALNELTGAKTQAKIEVAEKAGTARGLIQEGMGKAASIEAAADATAYGMIVSAKAQAQQIRQLGLADAQRIASLGKALRENPAATNLEVLQKWDGKVPSTVLQPGQQMMLQPAK